MPEAATNLVGPPRISSYARLRRTGNPVSILLFGRGAGNRTRPPRTRSVCTADILHPDQKGETKKICACLPVRSLIFRDEGGYYRYTTARLRSDELRRVNPLYVHHMSYRACLPVGRGTPAATGALLNKVFLFYLVVNAILRFHGFFLCFRGEHVQRAIGKTTELLNARL